jgi:hypothetical protein
MTWDRPAAMKGRAARYRPGVVIATDVQMIIGSAMPVVLAIGFAAILVLRRRDRRHSEPDDD